MAKDFNDIENSNPSPNPTIYEVSDPKRRRWIQGGLGGTVTALLGPLGGSTVSATPAGHANPRGAVQATKLGVGSATFGPHSNSAMAVKRAQRAQFSFEGVAASKADAIRVPAGYTAQVLTRWGDPVGIPGQTPEFRADASNSAAEQAVQFGMHHDALHFFPFGEGEHASRRGLLVINHEYTDDGLLHPGGLSDWTAEKTAKSINAHGVSICEVVLSNPGGRDEWQVVKPSRYARRITAATPIAIQGPAAGHRLMRTRDDPKGVEILGTLNNCAHGVTPWGTYLTCEENWSFYFHYEGKPPADLARYGARKAFYPWATTEDRFDLNKTPNEFNRFGWVVEIDPSDPTSKPIKRTALGRGAFEACTIGLTKDGRVVAYIGEDARFEYIYKFVSRDKVQPGGFASNRTLLDHGTLYVARFNGDGSGNWIELSAGKNGLTADKGFSNQGDVVIRLRQAADLVGGTKMDRPEWIAIDPVNGEVYCTLTNNSRRGSEINGHPVDAANPRANNVMGGIIRWKEVHDFDSLAFTWDHFILAGDPNNKRLEARGSIRGDIFACPDGLWFDPAGRLWIATDMHASQMNQGEFANLGNNMLLAANAETGEVRRFLTGPVNCEITGITMTPDLRHLFINVQHPGETSGDRSDPNQPSKYSSWPDGNGRRPRSSTVVIRRIDGGLIGT